MEFETSPIPGKLLIDQNISFCIKFKLAGFFSLVEHVSTLKLVDADDLSIWNFARLENFIIVKQDTDFNNLNILLGWPPKIIWLRCGNKPTSELIDILKGSRTIIQNFIADKTAGLLEIYK